MRGKDRTICWLVLDGVADRPAPALDGQTPLEAAATPNLDRLAAAGTNGTMDVSRPGTPLSSDRAHTLLFGYDHDEVIRDYEAIYDELERREEEIRNLVSQQYIDNMKTGLKHWVNGGQNGYLTWGMFHLIKK